MTMPAPLSIKRDGELEVDEYGFILSSCLTKRNRNDPSVLAFIDSFIRCKSIPQASQECGIHQSLGYKYRHRKDIANVIQKLIDKSNVKHGFDSSEILERVKEMVDFDPVELQNPDGSFKTNLHDIAPETRRCLKKLKVKNTYTQVEDKNGIKTTIITGEVIDYEWYDKPKSAELVGREKKMFTNTTRVEHAITKDMASILLESTKRADKAIEDRSNTIEIPTTEFKEVESE